jgi:cyclopropane-fatty-acyl-phospholipid synthase
MAEELSVREIEATHLLDLAQRARLTVVLDRLARRLLLSFAYRGRGLALDLVEGALVTSLGQPAEATITILDPRCWGSMVRHGSRGLCASYAAGWWETEDLTAVLRVLFHRLDRSRARLDRLANFALVRSLRDLLHRSGRPGRHQDRHNISAHYDLSNDFFECVLDETMTYSCAIFPRQESTLVEAQHHRIDLMCQRLQLGPADHLLEIGSGWGEFAVFAARNYGCRVTTTTISTEQLDYVRAKVDAHGLSDRITVLGADWRDLEGSFDKLVSVEMIEAVDWRNYGEFFAKCSALLLPGGIACIQAITIDDRSFERAKYREDFIKAMIFPGSCIPSLRALRRAIERASELTLEEVSSIGPHYGETLRRWRRRLHDNAERLDALGTPRELQRLFGAYLSYCEVGFSEGHTDDVHLVLTRGAERGGDTTRG